MGSSPFGSGSSEHTPGPKLKRSLIHLSLEGENSKEQLDALADRLYYARHPELQGRKIQEDETDLAKEWMLLRNNIEQEVEQLTEKLFHEQHPEL